MFWQGCKSTALDAGESAVAHVNHCAGIRSTTLYSCRLMDKDYGQIYEELYRHHWWFRVREEILLQVIDGLNIAKPAEILDVGCGNGLFFGQLERLGNVRGIEVDDSLIPANSPNRDRIFNKPLGDPQYAMLRFDLITALDVIEHIEDDCGAVADMLGMLRPGGKLLLTVPASMMLWDRHDEINRHYRRYSRESLRNLLAGSGRIITLKYLFHGLFLPKLAFRTFNRVFQGQVAQHAMPPAPINRVMKSLCRIEYKTLGRLRMPFGTSLLAVVEKAGG